MVSSMFVFFLVWEWCSKMCDGRMRLESEGMMCWSRLDGGGFKVGFRGLGFWRRISMFRSLLQASVAASRRAVAWNLKDITPPAEQLLFRFGRRTMNSFLELLLLIISVWTNGNLYGFCKTILSIIGFQSFLGQCGRYAHPPHKVHI
jgi:hypothetical protein